MSTYVPSGPTKKDMCGIIVQAATINDAIPAENDKLFIDFMSMPLDAVYKAYLLALELISGRIKRRFVKH